MSGLTNPSTQTAASTEAATVAALNQTVSTVSSNVLVAGATASSGTASQRGEMVALNQKLRKVTLTNNNTAASNKRFKITLFPLGDKLNSLYAGFADHYLGELMPGGSLEIGDPEVRAGVWAWCSDPAGGDLDLVVSSIP